MRPWHRSIALLAIAACRGDEPAPPLPTPTPTIVEPAPVDPRACGEAGPTPTPLPATLARGMLELGRGTLRAGETATLGAVKLRHDPSAWIGTMEAGFHAPALRVEVDPAETSGGPYGAQIELHAGQAMPAHIGPYGLEIRSAASDPVQSVDYVLTRDPCPPAAEIRASPAPVWLWLSTEAIRQHTYDPRGSPLYVTLDAYGGVPRLDVVQAGYRDYFEPRPGPPRSLRVGEHLVTIEEVVPGPGTRFEGRWIFETVPRVHARVRIEPAAALVTPQAVPTPTPCGDPFDKRTLLPADLGPAIVMDGEVTARPVVNRKLGDLEFELVKTVLTDRHGDDQTYRTLRVRGLATPRDISLGDAMYAPLLQRIDHHLLRLDDDDMGNVHVRHASLRCPEGPSLPPPSAPVYLWLSTHGHARVTFVEPGQLVVPKLTLQLFPAERDPSLGATAEQAYLTRALRPEDVGQGFTLGDHLVEIVDVQIGEGTRLVAGRYMSTALTPALHVQLRVSPAP